MKKFMACLILGALLLCGCKYERIVPEEQLTEKSGLVYEKDAKKPFTGIAVRLYPSGEKRGDIHYVQGKRHGKAVLYDKKGNTLLEGAYADDKMVGEWIGYIDGKVSMKEVWKQGRQIQYSKYFDNGKPASEYTLDEDAQIMERTAYSEDGKTSAKIVIDLKNKTGKLTIFGEEPSESELTLTLSDDKKYWNVKDSNKTMARINTETYVFRIAK